MQRGGNWQTFSSWWAGAGLRFKITGVPWYMLRAGTPVDEFCPLQECNKTHLQTFQWVECGFRDSWRVRGVTIRIHSTVSGPKITSDSKEREGNVGSQLSKQPLWLLQVCCKSDTWTYLTISSNSMAKRDTPSKTARISSEGTGLQFRTRHSYVAALSYASWFFIHQIIRTDESRAHLSQNEAVKLVALTCQDRFYHKKSPLRL